MWFVIGQDHRISTKSGVSWYYAHTKGALSMGLLTSLLLWPDWRIWNWSPECEGAFKRLKNAPCSSAILSYPQSSGMFILDTDANNIGIGAGYGRKSHLVCQQRTFETREEQVSLWTRILDENRSRSPHMAPSDEESRRTNRYMAWTIPTISLARFDTGLVRSTIMRILCREDRVRTANTATRSSSVKPRSTVGGQQSQKTKYGL